MRALDEFTARVIELVNSFPGAKRDYCIRNLHALMRLLPTLAGHGDKFVETLASYVQFKLRA